MDMRTVMLFMAANCALTGIAAGLRCYKCGGGLCDEPGKEQAVECPSPNVCISMTIRAQVSIMAQELPFRSCFPDCEAAKSFAKKGFESAQAGLDLKILNCNTCQGNLCNTVNSGDFKSIKSTESKSKEVGHEPASVVESTATLSHLNPILMAILICVIIFM